MSSAAAAMVALQGEREARELQRVLEDGQRRAPDLRDLTEFSCLRGRAALHQVQLYRSHPADGRVIYFSTAHGASRLHPDLASVRSRIEDLEAGDDRAIRLVRVGGTQ